MLVLALAILVLLAWLLLRRMQFSETFIRRATIAGVIACVCAALALRAGAATVGLLITAAALALWLRGRGGGGWGDDGREPPPDPEPDPGEGLRPEHLDREAFDRARAEWEHELPKRS